MRSDVEKSMLPGFSYVSASSPCHLCSGKIRGLNYISCDFWHEELSVALWYISLLDQHLNEGIASEASRILQ
ncbi:hypothetical protein AXF42_Ash006677 [Apostasia shenzhenica]|uniref:Uncharacterized protein n=1 Tax=Apostasia shenzhenica TaxID=1088818 RepID=A0A2I0AIX3_9ASPA|nr:hypothetical protein AXF42_Ash006677 [Apostasia shenzhenica]